LRIILQQNAKPPQSLVGNVKILNKSLQILYKQYAEPAKIGKTTDCLPKWMALYKKLIFQHLGITKTKMIEIIPKIMECL